ncbi:MULTISPECIES: GumC family protein [unclassified Methylobacterium]|uniref:GumC family protein n=1 Tax=unclassified Methylobacterium TaxID=2615210 RepID=UPI0011C1F725|nr:MULTISPECIES: GumC family protein [unclassified Methylobacterium]QEE39956.1 lipopolysaccharide biosynthesis protein [Methylobacterium sp. WL1]TXN02662.1 lipopolysaccharide biosynthesis protein [Methylobacterium sp. WL64]TXN56624.1 lipopolysaccharide biosynthesis protein [Methylobacterium sp. WL2]
MSRISLRSPIAAPVQRTSPRDGVGLAQVPQILRRSIGWIVGPTLVVALGASIFVNVVSPRYTGEAKLILESRDPAFARTAQERADQLAPIDEQAVASQVQVVMSRDLAREAIRRLKLVGNPEFDPGSSSIGPVQRVLMMLGIGANPLDRPAEDRVLDAYFEHLLVFPAGKSRILTIEFRAKDAKLAAEGANTIAQLYISSLEADKVDTARYASTWLGGNIDGLRKRVAEAEAKVEAFRAKNGLVGSGGATGQPLTTQQLGELSSQLSQARILKADLAGRVKAIKDLIKDGRAFEITEVANNEVVRRIVDNRIAVRAQLALESRTLLPAHPRIKELHAQLEDLDAQIKTSAERIARTLENDAKIAGSRVESLQAAVDGQQDVVVKGNTSEIQLRALEREAKAQREQLESYLSRYREAAARDGESATPADARIVSRAVTPEVPSFPKKLPIVSFATLVTLMLAVGGVLASALLAEGGRNAKESDTAFDTSDRRPRREPELERPTFAFPEAMPPAHWSEDEAVPATAAPAPVARMQAEAYDLAPLIARIGGAGRLPGDRSGYRILVMETEASPGENALHDALVRALGRKASLVTIDLNNPHAGTAERGFSDLIAGDAAFLDVIQSAGESGLHRIAAGRTEADVLFDEPDTLSLTFEAMAEAYGWVVCRLRAAPGAVDLLELTAGYMDSVIIASNAAAEDPALADLYAIAEDAGAGQILVAQDRAAEHFAQSGSTDPELRLRAA